MVNTIRSIEQAIDIFSDEVGLPLTKGPANSFEVIAEKYGDKWLDKILPKGMSANKLYLNREYYGGMVYQQGWNGVMKACTWSGGHIYRPRLGISIQRESLFGSNYLRGDNNGTPFLGIEPTENAIMGPLTTNWLQLVIDLRLVTVQ